MSYIEADDEWGYGGYYGDCGTFEYQWVTHYASVNYPSDGLLPQYTQIMRDNPTPNNEYEVNGANHIEVLDMSNHYVDGNLQDNTRATFNSIFNRPSTDWFYTN